MGRFRFQDLKIWQLAIEIANELFDVADDLVEEAGSHHGERIRKVIR